MKEAMDNSRENIGNIYNSWQEIYTGDILFFSFFTSS